MNATRWVLFDLGRVIVPFDHRRVASALARRWPQHGREWWHRFIYGDGDEPSRNTDLDRGCTLSGEAYELRHLRSEICEAARGDISQTELTEIWNSIFDDPIFASLDLMLSLHAEGFRIGICSNTNREHWEWCVERAPALREVPETLFLSFEMHANKPERAYYERVLATTGAEPRHHVLLDDVEVNCAGAAAAGMGALLIDPPLEPAVVRSALASHWRACA